MLDRLEKILDGKRATIVGVGNPLCGDDGLGPTLVGRLHGLVRDSIRLVEAGETPEDFLGLLAADPAQVYLIIDAVDLGAMPGDAALLRGDDLAETGMGTHSGNLKLYAHVLGYRTGTEVFILAVQPGQTDVGCGLSVSVQESLDCLERMLVRLLM